MKSSIDKQLADSFKHCEYVAKTQARNFYYSFLTLPREKKAAMCAIYAFMRYSDDVSDDVSLNKAEQMATWNRALEESFRGEYGNNRILPAFHATAKKYQIPEKLFHELIEGTRWDLTKTRYSTFDELYQYCYRVASIVGFVCIHVWGFEPADGDAMRFAEACGLAFQLTNILRDVKEDVERDRIYLPQEDLVRFGVSSSEIEAGKMTPALTELIRFEVSRAKEFYLEAEKLTPLLHKDGKATYTVMLKIYRGILDEIELANYDVFSRRASISAGKKLSILSSALFRAKLGLTLGQ